MGNIFKHLASRILPKRSITNDQVWTDLCENIHLHYRNVRLDMSEEEWAEFVCAIRSLHLAMDKAAAKYRYEEGDPNFLVHLSYNHPLKPSSRYYPNRATLEFEKDETIHFHYRDIRLHLSLLEFNELASMFAEAKNKMDSIKPSPFKDIEKPVRVMVPIDWVQPYDAGHRCLAIDDEHRAGIEKCKELILSGKKIRPIHVSIDGIRLDGFKRYMAFKELGYKEIEAIVDPFPEMKGQQAHQSWIDDEN